MKNIFGFKFNGIKMKKHLASLVIVLFVLSNNSLASIIGSNTTKISWLEIYPTLNDGGVVFTIENPVTECKGYWLNPNSAGYEASLSFLLSAYHAKTPIAVSGRTEITWPHSSSPWCELYSLKYPS